MNSLHPRPVLEVLADSRGEAAGDTERRGESGPVEVLEPTGGERCAERAAHRRRVPAACVKLPRRRHADPGHRLVTGDRRRHDRPAAVPAGFAERQHRGQDHRRGVGDRDGVRVVEVEPVRESAVKLEPMTLQAPLPQARTAPRTDGARSEVEDASAIPALLSRGPARSTPITRSSSTFESGAACTCSARTLADDFRPRRLGGISRPKWCARATARCGTGSLQGR